MKAFVAPNPYSAMRSTEILVISDRPVIRRGIASIISGHPHMQVIGEIDGGAAALASCAGMLPHIVIVDMSAPEMRGISILKKIRLRHIQARVIVFTSSVDQRCIRKLIEAGASAVLLTTISTERFIDAIRGVSAGERRIDPELMERLYFDIAPRLSEREVEVLAFVAKGHTNSKIGALLGIAAETVKTHLKNLLSKLGASNRTEAVMIAMKRGLLEL
jgi:DNA-binding NarL/FixJ family response regulator